MKYLNYLPVVLNDKNPLADGFKVGDQKIHLVIRQNGEEGEYWTNVDCQVHEDFKFWKKGDRVFIKYVEMRTVFGMSAENASTRVVYVDGLQVCLINPEYVYATIRDGKVIAPNGFSLVLPVIQEKPKSKTIIILDNYEEDKYEEDVWKVEHVGGPSPESELAYGTDATPPLGSYVKVKKGAGIPLEASLNKRLTERYYLIRHNEVMGYEVRE